MSIFRGSGVAIVTPFKDDKSVDYKAFEKLLAFQLDNGTNAIVVCGTTGESSTLTDKEHAKLVKLAAKVVAGHVPIIAGCGSNNTEHAIHLTKSAAVNGADAIMQVTPYYNKATQSGLVRHFAEIAKSTELPIMLYNVPARTSCNIEAKTVAKLSKIDNIVCVKEASGDISQIAEIRKLCGKDFDIYSGNDDQVVPLMSLGAAGVVSVVANIAPRLVSYMCSEYLAGNVGKSLEIQLELLDLNKACFVELSPGPVKEALEMMGLGKANYRSPMGAISEENRKVVREVLERFGMV